MRTYLGEFEQLLLLAVLRLGDEEMQRLTEVFRQEGPEAVAASALVLLGIRDTDRAATTLPVAVGLGVSTRDQAAEVASFADGVIVGSAFVRQLLDAPDLASGVAGCGALAADRRAIVAAAHFDELAVCIFDDIIAAHAIAVAQADPATGGQTLEARCRLFREAGLIAVREERGLELLEEASRGYGRCSTGGSTGRRGSGTRAGARSSSPPWSSTTGRGLCGTWSPGSPRRATCATPPSAAPRIAGRRPGPDRDGACTSAP